MRQFAWRLFSYALVAALVGGTSIASAAAKEAKKHADGATTKAAKDATGKPAADVAKAKEGEEAKPAKHVVKKAPFRVEINLEGVFEAQQMWEVSVRPREWIGLTVLKAVEHGATVKRGDLLVALDCEKIDRAITDLQKDLQLGEIALKQAEEQLAALERTAPLDLKAVDRYQRMVAEDLKEFFANDKPMSLKMAEFTVQMYKDAMEYEQEELKQLEKMYKADDLTEETEAIVLKRARDSVKRAKFNYERAVRDRDDAVKFGVPRREEKVKDAAKRAAIDWNRAQITFPLALNKARLDVEKLRHLRAQSLDKLAKLQGDRAAMTVKSPADGIVYYGKCTRGKWSVITLLSEALRPGGSVTPNDIFMTIVQSRPLLVRVTVPEAQLQHLHAGLKGTVQPNSFPDLRLTAIVERVGTIPISTGSFDARLTLGTEGLVDAIMPGMNCDVKLVPYKKDDALAVPSKAVFTDDRDEQKRIVFVVSKDDKPQKRQVTIGKRNDKQVEILKGLSEGEQVLTDRPKDM